MTYVAMARRDRPGKAGKSFVSQDQLAGQVAAVLADIHASLFSRAVTYRNEHILEPKDYEELKETVKDNWAFTWWCGSAACEAKVKEDTRATTRCIPLDQPGGSGPCIVCGAHSTEKVYWARAY